ncbi:MAG: hypothetical protein RIT04_167 [Candidatus Parcubacteria bacterium]|jgi:prepilin-type N-terminal cleavage/methylation domain-containing protein
MNRISRSLSKGFTLIETLVGVAVFAIVALASYQAYVAVFAISGANQYKILALNLINEEFEIVRNMPYVDIGIVNGIPNGKIPYEQQLVRGGITFTLTATVRNIDLSFDGQAGSSTNDTSPADNKLVEFTVSCASCANFTPITLTSSIAPKNLETASTNGVLAIKVFDANGVVIPNAAIAITNAQVVPNIVINDVTDSSGMLQVVDAPTGTNAYAITVTKSGYSSDRTYPLGGGGNPNPAKPDSTVLLQQVTPISFSIDKVSSLAISSVTDMCVPVSNIDFTLVGSKTIDAAAAVPKYSQALSTNGSGLVTLSNMEWDSYTLAGADSSYDVIGLNPLNPIVLNPGVSQSEMIIVAPKSPNSLLVTVKDSSTQLPLYGASVTLSRAGYSSTQITGQGYLTQTDWSGGAGQSDITDVTKYVADDGNIDTTTVLGDIKLKSILGNYAPSGILESSTFDTGSVSNFNNLFWLPTSQSINVGASSVQFQIATNATNTATTTWNYLGPDGTASTYYTNPGASIWSGHNGDRYLRYRLYLSTSSSTSTPNVSDISFTFTTLCTPPGQVRFSGLSAGTYDLVVGKSGYATTTIPSVTVSSSWLEQQVMLGI